MKKEIYIMLTKGNDGKFCISTYETLEKAQKMLETYIAAQKDIEGVGGNVYIDYHKFERLSVPGFALKPDAIITHVTFNSMADGKVIKTDRYIIKANLE
jgi:hypothetical protein